MSNDEDDEDDESYREVDPMEVIDDRLMLLEAWLQEDPLHEDVSIKRDEYMSLMEELEILGKKMRKSDKLLAVPNQPKRAKLERKRAQYTREVQDIVLYAEQDAFFQIDEDGGEHSQAVMNAYMRANSLLGKPLETLAEMTGFEDSKCWNDSGGVLDVRARLEEKAHSKPPPASKNNSHSDSIDNLDLSKPHNVTILKKKLKKLKRLLEDSTTEKDRKQLLKKHQAYKAALAGVVSEEDARSSGGSLFLEDGDTSSNASEESIELPHESPIKKMTRKAKNGATKEQRRKAVDDISSETKREQIELGNEDEEYILLKKKLKKALKLLDNTTSKKQSTKFEKKVQEYLKSLNGWDAWDAERSQYGFQSDEDVVVTHEEQIEEQIRQEEADQRRRSEAKSILKVHKSPQAEKELAARQNKDQFSELNLASFVEEDKEKKKLLRKKLRKVEKMLEAKIDKEGDDVRYTKEFRKLQKKRKEYLAAVGEGEGEGEDHESLASVSIGVASSLDTKNTKGEEQIRQEDHFSELNLANFIVEDKEKKKLIGKKLRKLEKMIQAKIDTEGDDIRSTKEFRKLQKKRKEYLSAIGEGEDHESLASVSIGVASSLDRSIDLSHKGSVGGFSTGQDSGSVDVSLLSPNASPASLANGNSSQGRSDKKDAKERAYQLEEERLAHERQRQRQERLASRDPKNTKGKEQMQQEDHFSELNLASFIVEDKEKKKLIGKKLRKLEKMIQAKIDKEGDDVRSTKEFRKLQKKRKEYLAAVGEGEDHESLASVSIGVASSLDRSMDQSHRDNSGGFSTGQESGSVDVSLLSPNASPASLANGSSSQGRSDKKDARERAHQLEEGRLAHERQRQRQERLASRDAKNTKGDDDTEDVKLIRKKLNKLQKMLKAATKGSKDYLKLKKKKKQYLIELGEDV